MASPSQRIRDAVKVERRTFCKNLLEGKYNPAFMALSPGSRLGPYEVLSPLGAGGMGEVYRANDTTLKRDVALKVLPEAVAKDAERMARFQREAQVLASLNHPGIASIYGLEESSGVRALVMELVEGPTLAERIAQGSMPLDDALPMAKQIAEALEFAHEKGIIHRDLKPANIKITHDGAVKLLDFGLAKALTDDPAASDSSSSPTLSMAATKAGIILGTAAYMSPEQAKGKSADRRADIWSFGVVLFEMLSGKMVFTGETPSEVMAHVITKEPNWSLLPSSTPARIRQLLERCLRKDPKVRLRDIGDARIAIEETLSGAPQDDAASAASLAVPQSAWRGALPWLVALVALVAAVLAVWSPWHPQPAPPPAVRLSVDLGADATPYRAFGTSVILSSDGARLAFVAVVPGDQRPKLFVRPLDQLQATLLPGTEGARDPFFSPDGEWIAFFADGKLKKISVQGGAAVTLCEALNDRGGAWSEDGSIFFSPSPQGALLRVSSAGGVPEPATLLDKAKGEVTHRWPQILPGGKAILFTASLRPRYEDASIVVQTLKTGDRKTVLEGGFHGRYSPSGHLLYMHQGTLFATRFDLDRLQTTGAPAPFLEGITFSSTNAGTQFAFSDSGTLVYLLGGGNGAEVSLDWLDTSGKLRPLRNIPALYFSPQFAPDDKRLAVTILNGGARNVWLYDWQRDTMTRLTFDANYDGNPSWTSDGSRIAFVSDRNPGRNLNIYWQKADGTGDTQRLTESNSPQFPGSWSPDGKVLAFSESNSDTSWDIMLLPMEGDEKLGWKPGKPQPFLNSRFAETSPAFSPDGHWLAYDSDESGQQEVYVRPYPAAGGKWQVSTGGGARPKWSHTRKELFYESPDNHIMVATYTTAGGSFNAEKPRPWSDVQIYATGSLVVSGYDPHPDGKRLAVLMPLETKKDAAASRVYFILNFFDELRRRVPAGKQ